MLLNLLPHGLAYDIIGGETSNKGKTQMSDDHHFGEGYDPNGEHYTGGLSMGSLLLFIAFSIAIAAAGYYGIRYVYSGLPPKIFTHHETH